MSERMGKEILRVGGWVRGRGAGERKLVGGGGGGMSE